MSINKASDGFINHARMAFVYDPRDLLDNLYTHKPNGLEKVGNFLSWHVVQLPKKIVEAVNDPRVVTVALTIAALALVQFAFYPAATILACEAIGAFITAHVSAAAVKLAVYITTQTAIVGLGARALGRFTNDVLMYTWHDNHFSTPRVVK